MIFLHVPDVLLIDSEKIIGGIHYYWFYSIEFTQSSIIFWAYHVIDKGWVIQLKTNFHIIILGQTDKSSTRNSNIQLS